MQSGVQYRERITFVADEQGGAAMRLRDHRTGVVSRQNLRHLHACHFPAGYGFALRVLVVRMVLIQSRDGLTFILPSYDWRLRANNRCVGAVLAERFSDHIQPLSRKLDVQICDLENSWSGFRRKSIEPTQCLIQISSCQANLLA